MAFWKNEHVTPAQVIILGFLLLILTGTGLLMLPISSRSPGGAPFLDALFTAASATCVTGLVLHDTVTYWSEFGQAVILLLIQTGGMGVVTTAVAVSLFTGKRIGLRQRCLMQEAIAAPQVGGIIRMAGFILKATFLMEAAGTLFLALRFCPEMGLFPGLWFSLFHSVSAFCNAGFDLMGAAGPFSSLTNYVGDPLVCGTIMGLIVAGGIGFFTWEDLCRHRWHLHAYRLQSKLILTITAALILLPALALYLFEFSQPRWETLTFSERRSDPFGRQLPDAPDPPDARRRLPRLHRRRLQDHHPGHLPAQRPGCIPKAGEYPMLWTPPASRYPAQRGVHLYAVCRPLPHRRGADCGLGWRPPLLRPF